VKTAYKSESQLTEPVDAPSEFAVMLVDDQVLVAKALRQSLAEAPEISLHYCPDASDAIKMANTIKPTVILQDLVMPSIDGLELVGLFRANPTTAKIPVIVLSSEENPQVKSRAFAVGANDYLVKPPDKTELIARLRYHTKAYLSQIERNEAFQRLRESQQQLLSLNTKLEEAYEKLDGALREAEHNAKQASQLTDFVDVLQSCRTMEEAYKIASTVLPTLLSCKSGALCITASSRSVTEAVAVWGQAPSTAKSFAPDDCWALRRGKTHIVRNSGSPLRCAHVNANTQGSYLCVPLAAQGETLGVLYVEHESDPNNSDKSHHGSFDALSRQAAAIGERISLTLANINLREVLRVESIHDPLTGLFNRRFMEDSLEREVRRASRSAQTLAVLMIDIDHFKRFNDTFGHQAGDTLLRNLGQFFRQRTRAQDVACRFGGEEFAVILTSASVDAAAKRAEILREELRDLSVEHAGQKLGKVTLSIGVAVYPIHASSRDDLVRIADQALYQAKNAGRDRVVVGTAS
jgi:diguanylate cyclase (GGDEF)-like protein